MSDTINDSLEILLQNREFLKLNSSKSDLNQRYAANMAIIEILSLYLNKYPMIRFGQALINLNIVETKVNEIGLISVLDPFNEEPVKTVAKILKDRHLWS